MKIIKLSIIIIASLAAVSALARIFWVESEMIYVFNVKSKYITKVPDYNIKGFDFRISNVYLLYIKSAITYPTVAIEKIIRSTSGSDNPQILAKFNEAVDSLPVADRSLYDYAKINNHALENNYVYFSSNDYKNQKSVKVK